MLPGIQDIKLPEKRVEGPDASGVVTETEYKMENGNVYEIITKREESSRKKLVPEAVAERMKIKPVSEYGAIPEVTFVSLNPKVETAKPMKSQLTCRICGSPHITTSCPFSESYKVSSNEQGYAVLDSEHERIYNDPSIRITGVYDSNVDEEFLKALIKYELGITATRANVLRDKETMEPRGMAFMNFATEEEANIVLEHFKEGYFLNEQHICLGFERSRR